MAKKIILSERERADLLLLIGNSPVLKKLAEHYSTYKSDYEEWAQELYDTPIKFGEKTKNYRGNELVSALADRIKAFDGQLYVLVNFPQARKILNVDYEQVCYLFARNSWAENPVQPGEKNE